MDRDNRIRKIINDLADAAYSAADGVSDAVFNASHVVGEKYDVLRLNLEISRLQNEQDKLFAGIGHTMYLIQTGEIKPTSEDAQPPAEATETGEAAPAAAAADTAAQTAAAKPAHAETMDAQQTIDRLLLLADQKQQEIDAAYAKLRELNGEGVCPRCGQDTQPGAAFCAVCGTKLQG